MMLVSTSSGDVKRQEETDSRLVEALKAFKVKLSLRTKDVLSDLDFCAEDDATTHKLVFISLTHRDTFSVFAGEFSKEDLVKLNFHQRCPIEADLQIIQDAFYGTQSDITLQCGFVNTEDRREELLSDYFDGANVLLKIKEDYRGHVLEYKFALRPKKASAFERQSKVNESLRAEVEDLSTTVATMKTGHLREMGEMKGVHSREIARVKEETTRKVAQIDAKLDKTLRTLKAEHSREISKLTSSLKKVESVLSQRSVTFWERIAASQSRPSGWSNVAFNGGHFGEDSAERCSFAQLLDGCVRITADGDYELAANFAVAHCYAFGMQLVVCGTDDSSRVLDAVGGGYHSTGGGYVHTSVCHVHGVWLPIAAGSIITMRSFVEYSSDNNSYAPKSVLSEMKDKSIPICSVTIRKLS